MCMVSRVPVAFRDVQLCDFKSNWALERRLISVNQSQWQAPLSMQWRVIGNVVLTGPTNVSSRLLPACEHTPERTRRESQALRVDHQNLYTLLWFWATYISESTKLDIFWGFGFLESTYSISRLCYPYQSYNSRCGIVFKRNRFETCLQRFLT